MDFLRKWFRGIFGEIKKRREKPRRPYILRNMHGARTPHHTVADRIPTIMFAVIQIECIESIHLWMKKYHVLALWSLMRSVYDFTCDWVPMSRVLTQKYNKTWKIVMTYTRERVCLCPCASVERGWTRQTKQNSGAHVNVFIWSVRTREIARDYTLRSYRRLYIYRPRRYDNNIWHSMSFPFEYTHTDRRTHPHP